MQRLLMIIPRIVELCNTVEALALELDRLNARGRGHTAPAVLMRMKLAAMTAELVTADVIERAREAARAPAPARASDH